MHQNITLLLLLWFVYITTYYFRVVMLVRLGCKISDLYGMHYI